MSKCQQHGCGCAEVATAMRSMSMEFCFAVPGWPITHVAECAAEIMPQFEWCINEKVAVEAAVGLSAVGHISVVMCKQNGLNIALDSLLNATMHSIGAALVVVVADDVDCSGSTALQDSRMLAGIIGAPLIEPTMRGDLVSSLAAAVSVSQAHSIPVIVRLTAPVPPCATQRDEPLAGLPGERLEPRTLNRDVSQGPTKLGRMQQHRLLWSAALNDKMSSLAVAASSCASRHDFGVVAVGATSRHVPAAGCCSFTLRCSSPLPDGLADFVRHHDVVLVAEEPLPYLEERIAYDIAHESAVIGRLTGHLPPEGPLSQADLARARSGGATSWSDVELKQSGSAKPAGQHADLFSALRQLRSEGVYVAADVGTSVNLCYPPYAASDVAICLGSAIAVAGGVARTGRQSIAVIGDYGFLHCGIQSALDVVQRGLPTLVVIMVNAIQAKTGGQPAVEGLRDPGAAADMLREVINGMGKLTVDSWNASGTTAEQNCVRMRELLTRAPAVALVRG